MAHVTETQRKKLLELGRPPIELPAEIFFGGNESLQRAPGRHHLPQYQKTGTYMHPNLVKHRLRVAEDQLKRALEMKMSETERKLLGGGDPAMLKANVDKYKKEWLEVIGKEMQMEIQEKTEELSSLNSMPVDMDLDLTVAINESIKTASSKPLPTSGVAETINVQKKKGGRPPKKKPVAQELLKETPDDPGEPDVVAKAQMAAMARPSDDLTSD